MWFFNLKLEKYRLRSVWCLEKNSHKIQKRFFLFGGCAELLSLRIMYRSVWVGGLLKGELTFGQHREDSTSPSHELRRQQIKDSNTPGQTSRRT